MPIKLIPPFTTTKPAVLDLIDRAGAAFVEVDKLYKLWPYTDKGGITIAAVPPSELAVLQRFIESLLPELPSVVTGVPGCFYSQEWQMLTAHLPSSPFSELETQLVKSGYLSHTTAQAEERGTHAMTKPALASFSIPKNGNAADPAPGAEEEEEEGDA